MFNLTKKPKQGKSNVVNQIDLYSFDELTKKIIIESSRLIEFFKFNLIYLQLVRGGSFEFDHIREYR